MTTEVKKYLAKIGKKGGSVSSEAKRKAVRKNGQLGGRPPSKNIKDWTPFMDAVDECRRNHSITPLHRLFLKSHITRERALIHSTANYLCREFKIPTPKWAEGSLWLKDPWFVSGVENLKAMALVESPIEFRANHIFVLENFLSRV